MPTGDRPGVISNWSMTQRPKVGTASR
jgi:hypothetical protein